MARILSPVWAIIRGSIAGITYLAGPQHQIIARSRTSPVQPNTTYVQIYRSAFAQANLAWRLMTDSQRIGWADYAQTLFYSGPTGDYTVKGRNVFLAYYAMQRYLLVRGLTAVGPILDVTEFDGWLAIVVWETVIVTPSSTGISVSITNGSSTEDIEVHFQISRAFDATRHFFKGPWRTVDAAVDTITGGTSAYHEFLGLADGYYYFVRVRAFTSCASGARYSSEFVIRCQATTTGP